MRGDLDGGDLVVEQAISKFRRDAELGKPGAGFLRQVVRHLHVDLIRREHFLPRPAFINNLDQFSRNVDAPAITPSCLEPLNQLVGGIVIEHVDIQLALMGEAGKREIAATQVADNGIDRI